MPVNSLTILLRGDYLALVVQLLQGLSAAAEALESADDGASSVVAAAAAEFWIMICMWRCQSFPREAQQRSKGRGAEVSKRCATRHRRAATASVLPANAADSGA